MAKYNACKLFYFGPEKPSLPKNVDINLEWIPLVHIIPIENSIRGILNAVKNCDSIVFTSPRGVRIAKEYSLKQGLLSDIKNLFKEKRVIVIGGSTGKALENEFNIKPCCLPDEWDSWGLGDLLCKIRPKCCLLLRSRQASPVLDKKLEECSIRFQKVVLYDIRPRNRVGEIMIPKGCPIILSSSLIARTFIEKYGCPNDHPVIALGIMTLKLINSMCSGVIVYRPSHPLLEEAIILARNIVWDSKDKIEERNKS